MKKNRFARMLAMAVVGVLMAALLAGCATQADTEISDEQEANRQYMSSVNQAAEDLANRLDSFEEAVARGDIVTMRTQADDAFEALDTLAALEAPEAFEEIQADYAEGCNALEEALNAYIDLYAEIDSATDDSPFDYSTYDERIQEIQDLYDEGISKLESADEKVSELE